MSDPNPAFDTALSKHRLEALSDGVFAVVMTLLVLELRPELPPQAGDADVTHALHELARPLIGYAFAFIITGIFWALHHRKFALLRHTNGPHTALTLAFLFTVTLLPLSVSIYLKAKSSGIARSVYFGNFTLIALTLLASWLYARRTALTDHTAAPESAAGLTWRMAAMSAMGGIACVASWFNWNWVIFLALPVIVWLRRRRKPRPGATPAGS